jgi:hypothetical protein
MFKFKFGKLLIVSAMVLVSAGAFSVDAQRRERTRTWDGGRTVTRTTTLWSGQRSDRRWNRDSDRRWHRDSHRRVRNTYGYRNYGQYRRTQVGNRRFRTVNRYTLSNGRRVVRRVRVDY